MWVSDVMLEVTEGSMAEPETPEQIQFLED